MRSTWNDSTDPGRSRSMMSATHVVCGRGSIRAFTGRRRASAPADSMCPGWPLPRSRDGTSRARTEICFTWNMFGAVRRLRFGTFHVEQAGRRRGHIAPRRSDSPKRPAQRRLPRKPDVLMHRPPVAGWRIGRAGAPAGQLHAKRGQVHAKRGPEAGRLRPEACLRMEVTAEPAEVAPGAGAERRRGVAPRIRASASPPELGPALGTPASGPRVASAGSESKRSRSDRPLRIAYGGPQRLRIASPHLT